MLATDVFQLLNSTNTEMIEQRCYARVGILGNPSDGYAGKTLSSTIENFGATIRVKKHGTVRFEPNPIGDQNEFTGFEDFLSSIKSNGYDGGIKLLMATTKMFWDALREERIIVPVSSLRGFSMSYETDVPRQLGLAGSSAICTAAFRALMAWYGVPTAMIPNSRLAGYVLRAEQQELGIAAGLQDRVSQAFDRPVFMDFTPEAFKTNNGTCGMYEPLPDSSIDFFNSKMFLLFPSDKERIRDATQGKSSARFTRPFESVGRRAIRSCVRR
jgi:glucuronokinase